jgi:mRNA interferase RelE/StbE
LDWTIKISDFAEKQIKKLDSNTCRRILDYLYDRLEGCKDPRHFGEPLKGNQKGYWRYRVGDYRIICEFQNAVLVVVVIAIGHRKEIYRSK